MPSDEALEQLGANVAVGVWINVSLLLSTLVPILGILYLDSLIFWVVSCHSRGSKGSPLPGGAKNEDRAEVLSAIPDAYALKPFPTAVLLTIQSIGAAIILTAGKAHAVLGMSLMVIGTGLYSILSGLARANENRVNPNGSA